MFLQQSKATEKPLTKLIGLKKNIAREYSNKKSAETARAQIIKDLSEDTTLIDCASYFDESILEDDTEEVNTYFKIFYNTIFLQLFKL